MDVQFLYARGNDIHAFKKDRTTDTIEKRQGVNILAVPSFVIMKLQTTTPAQLKSWSWIKNVVNFSEKRMLHYDSQTGSGNGKRLLQMHEVKTIDEMSKHDLCEAR
ncbi:hypothetical protein OS493_008035 [Desmophyllum pertusum]|uniref:Uncharacterized protein n=1 Tax=Desmophyllum pertusum TaxID=174260 RepID=A0A9X0CFN0_9CNID|nr:hypothetical protein OS493_008035 [Desmophyllum pertusum]